MSLIGRDPRPRPRPISRVFVGLTSAPAPPVPSSGRVAPARRTTRICSTTMHREPRHASDPRRSRSQRRRPGRAPEPRMTTATPAAGPGTWTLVVADRIHPLAGPPVEALVLLDDRVAAV